MFKNLLLLLPEDELTIFNQLYEAFKNFFQNSYRTNYTKEFKKYGLKKLEQNIKNKIEQNKIDTIVLCRHIDSFVITPEYLKELKNNKNLKIICMFFDDEMYQHAISKYYAQIADGVITTDYYGSYYYEQIGIPTEVYFGGYPKDVYEPKNLVQDINISFVGNMLKQDRKEYIDFLESKGVKVETFGLGSKNGFLDETEFADIFSRSKINLNFTKTELKLQPATKEEPLSLKTRQNKGRPIEIALCGGFCLSEYSYTLGNIFDIDDEIDHFLTKEELYEKIKYYLQNDEKRSKLAQKAYKKATKEYEINSYITKVFNCLEQKIRKHNIYDDNIYYNTHFLFYKSEVFFRYFLRSFKFGWQELIHTIKRGIYPYKLSNFFGFLHAILILPKTFSNKLNATKLLKLRDKKSKNI